MRWNGCPQRRGIACGHAQLAPFCLPSRGGKDHLESSLAEVHRGLDILGSSNDAKTRGQRGWLHNNAALVSALRYLNTRDSSDLGQSAHWLTRAMSEIAAPGRPLREFPELRYNASMANAVQLLEILGRHGRKRSIDWTAHSQPRATPATIIAVPGYWPGPAGMHPLSRSSRELTGAYSRASGRFAITSCEPGAGS